MQLVDCLRFSPAAGAHTTEGCGSIANSRLTRARRAREADERFLSSCSPLGLNRPGVMLVMNFRSRVCDSRAQPWQCHRPKRLVGLGVCLFASTRLTLTFPCHDRDRLAFAILCRNLMASLFRLGQLLRGNVGTYTIQKQLHESIWLATYVGTNYPVHRPPN